MQQKRDLIVFDIGDVNIEVLKANGMKKHYIDFSRFSFSEFIK